MPVLESTDHNIVPKSILPHRPIGDKSAATGKRSADTGAPAAGVQRASRQRARPIEKDAIDVEEWERSTEDTSVGTRIPSRRTSAPTSSRTQSKTPLPQPAKPRRIALRRAHPLLYLGLGMLFMLILWTLVMGIAGWLGTTIDNWRYGYPRTFQTDQFVGHNETNGVASHFIAINLHGRIEVIEFPGGDASHARVYEGPQLFTANADLVPVTLKFEDLLGNHQLDMLVCFQGSQIVYINAQGQFVPLQDSQRAQVEQALQRPGMSC